MRPFPRSFLPLSVAAYGALTACTSIHDQHRSTLTTEARLQVAEAADASGDSDLAISMYIAAAANNPANIELQLRCADALARSGKVAQARQILTESLRANHGQIDLIRALAVIDLVAGQPVQAIAEFDQVLAANPGDSRALVDKAVALDLQGQHAAAQLIYRQALATAPDDPVVRNDLAVSMMLEGRIRQALETLAPMQDADGSPPRLKVNLGILYAATGNAERSRQLLGDRPSDGAFSALTQTLASSSTSMQMPPHLAPTPEPAMQPGATPDTSVVALAPVTVEAPPVQQTREPLAKEPPVPATSPSSTAAALAMPLTVHPALSGQSDQSRILLRARADTWVQVRDRAGAVLLNRMLHPGDSWAVPAKPNLLLTTGNAGDIDLVVDGLTSPSLGGHGVVRHDLPLDPDLIKDGRLVTVSPQPDPK